MNTDNDKDPNKSEAPSLMEQMPARKQRKPKEFDSIKQGVNGPVRKARSPVTGKQPEKTTTDAEPTQFKG